MKIIAVINVILILISCVSCKNNTAGEIVTNEVNITDEVNVTDEVNATDEKLVSCFSTYEVENYQKDYSSLDGGIDGYNVYMSEICTKEEFAVTKYKTLVRYNGDKRDNIIIPEGVLRIFSGAFRRTSDIKNIIIPSSVEKIDNGLTVKECINIKVDKNNKFFSDTDGVLFDKEKNTILAYPQRRQDKIYQIPNGVKKINAYAFGGCSFLKEVIINKDMEVISDAAFSSSYIKEITIPKNIVSIEGMAFDGCESLEEIIFEEGITYIADKAFNHCTMLENIKIPNTVTTIGKYFVHGCTNLEYIIIPSSVKKINGKLYDEDSKFQYSGLLYVEKGSYAEKYAKENGYKYKYYDFEKKQVIS